MTITPLDPPSRWHVTSASDPDAEHLVDIFANAGFGQCSCSDFTYRIQPEIDAGKPATRRCKHLSATREHFTDMVITRLKGGAE